MPTSFQRAVGAAGDVAELEYVAALLQTEKLYLRQEGSITAKDIYYYLKSRHGLRVDRAQIEREIIGELGGVVGEGTRRGRSTVFSSALRPDSSSKNAERKDSEAPLFSELEGDVLAKNTLVHPSSNNRTNKNAVTVDESIDCVLTPLTEEPEETVAEKRASMPSADNFRTSTTVRNRRASIGRRASVGTVNDSAVTIGKSRMNLMRLSMAVSEEDYLRYLAHQNETNNTINIEVDSLGENDDDNVINNTDSLEEGCSSTTFQAGLSERKLNLAHITSLLLIPKLCQVREAYDNSNITAKSDDDNGNNDEEEDLIGIVLATIIKESGGSISYNQPITQEMLAQILFSLTDDWDDGTIEAMMQTALKCSPAEPPRLNRETVLHLLTNDIAAYPLDISATQETAIQEVNKIEATQPGEQRGPLLRVYTAAHIDSVANTYRSKGWTILAWYAIVVTLVAYLFKDVRPNVQWDANCPDNSTFRCAIINSTVNWLEGFVQLSVVGFPFMFMATQGNSVHLTRKHNGWAGAGLMLFSITFVAMYVLVPYFYRGDFGLFHSDPESAAEEEGANLVGGGNNRQLLGPVSLCLGGALILLIFLQLYKLLLKKPTSNLRAGVDSKMAANYKVDKLVRNALACHIRRDRSSAKQPTSEPTDKNVRTISNTLVHYNQTISQMETVGGILWLIRKCRDRTLFYEEGLWIWPRLIASNIAQWTTVLIVIGFCLLAVYFLETQEEELYQGITNNELEIALIAGFPLSFLSAVSISMIYIPSALSGILRYRSGDIGSLHERRFLQRRFAMDTTNLLFGAAFWTCFCSTALFYAVVTNFFVLCFWTESRSTMLGLCANAVGAFVTVTIKQILMLLIRNKWSRGFYRSSPLAVNISNTVQEIWNLGLTTFTAGVRAAKFLGIFLLMLGRIDVEAFAPGVGWFMDEIPLDGLPYCFARDQLTQEAHRHPLIERLGMLYMIKLRLGSEFGTTGGAVWRVLFTCTLLPWLRQYRYNLGIVGKDEFTNQETSRSMLSNLSKDALVENLMAMEKKYKLMSETMKKLKGSSLSSRSKTSQMEASQQPSSSTTRNNEIMAVKEEDA